MKRTQIQLDEVTYEKLRERAFRESSSISGIIRRVLRSESDIIPTPKPKHSFSFIAKGRSRGKGSGRIAERHDAELSTIFGS